MRVSEGPKGPGDQKKDIYSSIAEGFLVIDLGIIDALGAFDCFIGEREK